MSNPLHRITMVMLGGLTLSLLLAAGAGLTGIGYVVLGGAVAVAAVWLNGVAREWRRLDRGAAGACLQCGYDLQGLADAGKCPECGATFGIEDLGDGPVMTSPASDRTSTDAANVEIKARVRDPWLLERTAAGLSGGPPTVLRQDDVFFPVPYGRLKLRRFDGRRGELILYDRPDDAGAKRSEYSIVLTTDPDALASMLTKALGSAGVVRKERRLYLVGQTRVHLDRVEGLGEFVELEVVLRPGQTTDEGRAIADDLMRRLDIRPEELVAGAYLDLLRDAPPRA